MSVNLSWPPSFWALYLADSYLLLREVSLNPSKSNLDELYESDGFWVKSNEDQTVLVKDYSKYYQSSNEDKIQNILKENIMLKERVKQLENQPKTVKNKYLINLFCFVANCLETGKKFLKNYNNDT